MLKTRAHCYHAIIKRSSADIRNGSLALVLCTVPAMRDLKITRLSDEFGQYVIYLRCEGAPVPPILPAQDGFLFLDRSKFAASFAADVEPELAAFMADSQVPWGVEALAGAVSKPAWRVKPSWYLVVTDDKMIPPPAQRSMAQRAESKVVESAGSHSVYVSKPKVVAALIAQAAREAK